MYVSKIKTTVAVVLALAVVGGAGVCTIYLHGQDRADEVLPAFKLRPKTAPDTKTPAKPAEEMRKLLKERRDMAELEVKVRYDKYRAGAQDATLDLVLEASKRLLKAELELSEKKVDRLAAHERLVELTKHMSQIVEAKYKVGRVSQADYAQAEYERLDAEIALERERAR